MKTFHFIGDFSAVFSSGSNWWVNISQQAITWTSIVLYLGHHMALLNCDELKLSIDNVLGVELRHHKIPVKWEVP